MTHLDLFSGIGGFALAAQANGVETKVFCENNEDCREFLERTWGLPIVRDVREFGGTRWRGAWLLTAGCPCQPASRAGKQAGADDDRWLWDQALRIVEESQPIWALFENPPGILDVGLDGILSELGRIGYEVQPLSIPACAVNSPQDRERIWIVAHRAGERYSGQRTHGHASHSKAIAKEQTNQPEYELDFTLENGIRTDVREKASGEPNGTKRIVAERTTKATVGNPEISNGSISIQSRRQDEAGIKFRGPAEIGIVAVGHSQPAIQSHPKDCTISRKRSWLRSVRDAWRDSSWLVCPWDQKLRRFPNSIYRVANGIPAGISPSVAEEETEEFATSILEALGNSICWPVAAEIIRAMIESETPPDHARLPHPND